MQESDGINEMMAGHMRVALTVAARVGEQLMRIRQRKLAEIQSRSEKEARVAQQQFNAERAASRAELAPVLDDRWWQKATEPQIVHAFETAAAWTPHEPLAEKVQQRIREEIHTKYGIELTDQDPRQVFAAAAEEATRRAEVAKHEAAAAKDAEEARTFMALASDYEEIAADNRKLADGLRDDISYKDPSALDVWKEQQAQVHDVKAAEHDGLRTEALSGAADKYDSAERRAALAARLEGQGRTPREIQARIVSDKDQARPAKDAVNQKSKGAPKARKARGTGADRAVERGR